VLKSALSNSTEKGHILVSTTADAYVCAAHMQYKIMIISNESA
jgi:hypothetical protein